MSITYEEQVPPAPAEARRLYRAVGWHLKPRADDATLRAVWHRADFVVTARDEVGHLVGMARAVGDGGFIIGVGDVVVHPDWQGQGIGREMMQRIMAFINSGPWYRTYLFSAPGKDGFYAKFGFSPPEPGGMTPMFHMKPEAAALHDELHRQAEQECCECQD